MAWETLRISFEEVRTYCFHVLVGVFVHRAPFDPVVLNDISDLLHRQHPFREGHV